MTQNIDSNTSKCVGRMVIELWADGPDEFFKVSVPFPGRLTPGRLEANLHLFYRAVMEAQQQASQVPAEDKA